MTHERLLYVRRGADGTYRDRAGRVIIRRDSDPTHPWMLTVDGWFYGRWPSLTDARITARDILERADARQAVAP